MVIQPRLARGPSVFFRLSTGYGLHSGLVICGSGLRGGCLSQFLVWVMVSLQSRLGSPLPFLIALWVVLVCLVGSGGRTLLTTVSMVFTVALYVPWCRYLESLTDVKPQLYADNLKYSAQCPNALFDAARYVRGCWSGRVAW